MKTKNTRQENFRTFEERDIIKWNKLIQVFEQYKWKHYI